MIRYSQQTNVYLFMFGLITETNEIIMLISDNEIFQQAR